MMNFLSGVLKIEVGLLAGLSLADLYFTIAVSRVSHKVRERLPAANLLLTIDTADAALLCNGDVMCVPPDPLLVSETCIVDDVAYPIIAKAEAMSGKSVR